MLIPALLATALLFGGMALHSFSFAAFLFTTLQTGPTMWRVFPLFCVTSAAAALLWPLDPRSAGLLAWVAATTPPARQTLTPVIDRATDAGTKTRVHRLHELSVTVTLVHVALAGYVLARFAGGLAI